jgi:uncharacterized protein YegP (UPF0339 family)
MAKNYVFYLFVNSEGRWQWVLQTASGEVMARSGTSYASAQACEAALETTISAAAYCAKLIAPEGWSPGSAVRRTGPPLR